MKKRMNSRMDAQPREKGMSEKGEGCCGGSGGCGGNCGCKKKSIGNCGGCAYFLGAIGAAIYYVGVAGSFWGGVVGVLKALVWPAFVVYEVLKYVAM